VVIYTIGFARAVSLGERTRTEQRIHGRHGSAVMHEALREFPKLRAMRIDAAATGEPLAIRTYRSPDAVAAANVRAEVLHRAVRAGGESAAFARSSQAPSHDLPICVHGPCAALGATERTEVDEADAAFL